ncbi:Serine/threonine-protein kinase PKH3 [Frankliniella fusca]|uniref:Serine/threonine-protein kinase PKH3 n=1 Tax=Frankliniella fusca TaxID=407009 RepID=A0AAE1LAB2_9NEOP|nr:Serine/threonine-protein kinase PKH3 [Frankliniella fusca]
MESELATVIEDEAEGLEEPAELLEVVDDVPDVVPVRAKSSSHARPVSRKRPIRRKKKKVAPEPRPETPESEGGKSPASVRSLSSFAVLAADFEAAIDDLAKVGAAASSD